MAFEDHLREGERESKGSPLVSLCRRKRGRPTVFLVRSWMSVCDGIACRWYGGVVNRKIVRAVANALLYCSTILA